RRRMAAPEFPTRPVPAVGAIVFRGSRVLLVRRRRPPNQRRWSIPGGAMELGETVEQAVVRETREETQVEVRPVEVITVSDFNETFIDCGAPFVLWPFLRRSGLRSRIGHP